jgi:hypothetical protein
MSAYQQPPASKRSSNLSDWLKWGPYLSERQWGTVREDYSAAGDAWNYITHDMARSKAYRWGEDGIGGICDDNQLLCGALALWNGQDPILKERLFGLTNNEGNHGEDVKEQYYYLDNTPTHSYMEMLYKYPQQAFPYEQLVAENKRRSRLEPEFELLDTGIFDSNRYFDVFIAYAKHSEEDILIRYTIENRASESAEIHIIPQFWFRNIWSYGNITGKPVISYLGRDTLLFQHDELGTYYCYSETPTEYLFTENETNNARLYQSKNDSQFTKDGFHSRIVDANLNAVNATMEGTKVGIWHRHTIPAGEKVQIRLRLTKTAVGIPFENFDETFATRRSEADAFYADKQLHLTSDDEKNIHRQASAGMLWSKQFYLYDVNKWLNGDTGEIAPPASRRMGRNREWKHLVAGDVISMPDKWEYPWFAAWDLAFHCISFAALDPDFAKHQLRLLVSAEYIHPNGQLPAYEWAFGDVNPPVHALAAWQVYLTHKELTGAGDIPFLEEIFQKLLLNFTWWVNQKDSEGNNIFEGGFLGLDNIGIFNRSAEVPGGGLLEQADGTSWMAMYALNMLQISAELAHHNEVYENMTIKFAEHFFYIAGSIALMGEDSMGLWDDEDGFYYDLLHKPDGNSDRLKLRTIVGLIPMFAVIVFDDEKWKDLRKFRAHMEWFMNQRPDLMDLVSRWKDKNGNEQHLLSLLRGHRMKLLLRRMLDHSEFLSDFGIRSVSRVYEKNPYNYWLNGADYSVTYIPAESDSAMFGGNSNWRGPIWMPLNYLIIQALYTFHEYYTDDFRVEYPTGSGTYYSLAEIAHLLSGRLKNIFLKDQNGERPVFGGHPKLNHDEHFKDYVLFYEYFHGNSGKGLGASHQTGWTGLVCLL